MLDNSSAVVDCNDGGLNKVSLGWKVGTLIPRASAIQDLRGTDAESGSGCKNCDITRLKRVLNLHLATLGFGCSNGVDKYFDSGSIMERAHKGARKEWIPDGNRTVGFDKLRNKRVVHVFMHVQAPQGGASLSCGSNLQG